MNSTNVSDQNRVKISLILVIFSMILYIISLFIAKYSTATFGYIANLPLFFWISLFLLLVSCVILWSVSHKMFWLSWLQVILLVTMLWLTPIIIGGLNSIPSLGPPLGYFGLADTILRAGRIHVGIHPYLNWPGSMLFTSMAEHIVGPFNPVMITSLTPFFLQSVLLLPLYVILHYCFKTEKANCWSPEVKYSAQSYAMVLLMVVLMLIVVSSQRKAKGLSLGDIIILIILVASIIITHFLTSLIVIIFLIGLFIARSKIGLKLTLFCIIVLFLWALYGASIFFDNNIKGFLQMALRLNILGSLFVGSNVFTATTSLANVIVNRAQVVSVLILLITTCIGASTSIRVWLKRKFELGDKEMIIFFISVIIGTVFSIYGYNIEVFYRLFWLALPVLVYFSIRLLSNRRLAILLGIVIIILVPIFFICAYGDLSAFYTSQQDLNGRSFITEHALNGQIVTIVKGSFGIARDFEKFTYVCYDPRYYPEQYSDPSKLLNLLDQNKNSTQFLILSETDDGFFNYVTKKSYVQTVTDAIISSNIYNRIFVSNGFSIYEKGVFR